MADLPLKSPKAAPAHAFIHNVVGSLIVFRFLKLGAQIRMKIPINESGSVHRKLMPNKTGNLPISGKSSISRIVPHRSARTVISSWTATSSRIRYYLCACRNAPQREHMAWPADFKAVKYPPRHRLIKAQKHRLYRTCWSAICIVIGLLFYSS